MIFTILTFHMDDLIHYNTLNINKCSMNNVLRGKEPERGKHVEINWLINIVSLYAIETNLGTDRLISGREGMLLNHHWIRNLLFAYDNIFFLHLHLYEECQNRELWYIFNCQLDIKHTPPPGYHMIGPLSNSKVCFRAGCDLAFCDKMISRIVVVKYTCRHSSQQYLTK